MDLASEADYLKHKGKAKPLEKLDNTSSSKEAQDSDGLLFITLTGPVKEAKSDIVSQRKIKVHARRFTLRNDQRALPTTVVDQPTISSDTSQKYDKRVHTSKFKLSTWTRKPPTHRKAGNGNRDKHVESSKYGNASGILNPLIIELPPVNNLPINLTPAARAVLNFYHNELRTNSFALNPEGKWFEFVRSDPLALLSHISVVSSLRNITLGIEDDTEPQFFRDQTIHEINMRLSKEKDSKLSEGLIGAVAVIVNREAVNGSYESATLHMNGLARMVDFNGGLEALNHNKILQRVITWSDFCYVSTWGEMPFFPLISSLSDSFQTSDRFLSRSLIDSKNFVSSEVVVSNREVLEVLEMLFSISEAISVSPFQGNREAISNSIYLVEYKLSVLNFGKGLESEKKDKIDVSKALALAVHLYLHLAIRELPANAQRYQVLFQRLKNVLPYERNLLKLDDPPFSIDLLLWIFFIAGADLFDMSARNLVLLKLQDLCFILGIRHREDFDAHLKNILWLDPFSSFNAQTLWNEMELFPIP